MNQPIALHPPETAPKDGIAILGDFGWPWLSPAAWNEYDAKWAVCAVQSAPMEPDGKNDTYWETDQEDPSALAGWLPIPGKPIKFLEKKSCRESSGR